MNDMQPVAAAKSELRSLNPATPRSRAEWIDPDQHRPFLSPARAAGHRRALRHRVAKASFLLLVVLPLATTITYLYGRAADQFHSEFAFSIRSEEMAAPEIGILGALTQISHGSAADADILNEFIRSQKMVEAVDARIGLRSLYARADDPVFGLPSNATPEDLYAYWARMVDVTYDSRAGIIHVRADAFSAGDAQKIAEAIVAESDALVNRLSDQARRDAIRYAETDLREAEARLRDQRRRLAEFRAEYRLVDPAADAIGQSGLLNALQAELAEALVERDTLLSYARDDDQRVVQVGRRIEAITVRIEAERTRLGIGGVDVLATDVLSRYEALRADLEFAQAAYTQALTNLTVERSEARRQSRYLAPHIEPTRAATALYPRRGLISGLAGLFLALIWCGAMILYYNIRDSR